MVFVGSGYILSAVETEGVRECSKCVSEDLRIKNCESGQDYSL